MIQLHNLFAIHSLSSLKPYVPCEETQRLNAGSAVCGGISACVSVRVYSTYIFYLELSVPLSGESRGCDTPVGTHYIKCVTSTGEMRPKILDVQSMPL